MRYRLAAIVAALVVFVSLAYIAPLPAGATPHTVRATTTVQTWKFDGVARGALVSTVSSTDDYPSAPLSGWDDPNWTHRDEGSTEGIQPLSASDIIHGGSASASGCRAYTQDIEDISLLHLSTIYRITQRYTWCWLWTHVYNMHMVRDVVNIAGNWSYEGVISSYSEYYSYHGFYEAGYRWYRKFHLHGGCVLWVCQDEYPWMKFWAHGDGTYSIQENNA